MQEVVMVSLATHHKKPLLTASLILNLGFITIISLIGSCQSTVYNTTFCDWHPNVCQLVEACWIGTYENVCASAYDPGKCCLVEQSLGKQYLIVVLPFKEKLLFNTEDVDNLRVLVRRYSNVSGLVVAANSSLWLQVTRLAYKEYSTQHELIEPIDIPDEICRLSMLELLCFDLGYWLMKTACFQNMTQLRSLTIANNANVKLMNSLDDIVNGMTSLSDLNLMHGLPGPCDGVLPATGQLFSERNNMSPLTRVNLVSIYTLPVLPANYFRGLNAAAVQHIHLTANKFTTIQRQLFSGMSGLQVIDLSSNNIVFLPEGLFDGLISVERVDLWNNNIYALQPSVFFPLTTFSHLKEIDLSYNGVADIAFNSVSLSYDRDSVQDIIRKQAHFFSKAVVQPGIKPYLSRTGYGRLNRQLLMQNSSAVLISFEGNIMAKLSDIIDGFSLSAQSNLSTATTAAAGRQYVFITKRVGQFVCNCEDIALFSNSNRFYFADINQATCEVPLTFESYSEAVAKRESHYRNFSQCHLQTALPYAQCPQCLSCVIDLNKNAIVVTAKCNTSITELPESLPDLPTYSQSWRDFLQSYQVDISHNNITLVSEHDYLLHTRVLNLSYNLIADISYAAGQQLARSVRVLDLRHNQLTSLPPSIQAIGADSSTVSLQELHLYGNPWSCDCHSGWMKPWLLKLDNVVVDANRILCSTNDIRNGKALVELDDNQFQCRYILSTVQYNVLVIVGVSLSIAVVICIILAVIYAKRHWLYTKFNLHPFDIDECKGEDMVYDVFVSYANEDEDYVMDLINRLESDHQYKTCYHRRDFLPGSAALENMGKAVMKSKRTLCYISENFLKSEWCVWEFMMALNLDLEHKRHRLIVIKDDALDIASVGNESIRVHLKYYTHIQRLSPFFNEQLLYSLPQKKLGAHIIVTHGGDAENNDNLYAIASEHEVPLLAVR